MTKELVTFGPETTAEDAVKTLITHNISGAPVLDSTGKLIGLISEFQLLAVIYDYCFRTRPIEQMMTKEIFTVEEQTSLAEVTTMFIKHRIRRLPVLNDGVLVGQISRRDIIGYAIHHGNRNTEELIAAGNEIERFVA